MALGTPTPVTAAPRTPPRQTTGASGGTARGTGSSGGVTGVVNAPIPPRQTQQEATSYPSRSGSLAAGAPPPPPTDPYLASMQAQLNGVYGQGRIAGASYGSDLAVANGSNQLGQAALNQNYGTDAALLASQQYRAGLDQQGNAQAQAYNKAMYGNDSWQNGAQYNNTLTQLNGNYGNDMSHLTGGYANNVQQLDQLGALFGQKNAADKGFNQTGYQNQLDALNGKFGLDQQRHAQQQQYLDQLQGFNGQSYANATGNNQLAFKQGSEQVLSDNTARGAVGSRGFGQANSNLASQLGLSNDQAGITRDRDLAAIGKGRGDNELNWGADQLSYNTGKSSAELGYNQRNSDLDNAASVNTANYNHDRTGLGLDYQHNAAGMSIDHTANTQSNYINYKGTQDGLNLNYQDQQQTLARNEKALNSIAGDYGIKSQDLKNKLSQGAAKLNLNYADTVAKITQAQQSNDAAVRAAADQLIRQMIQYGG